jgi:lipoate-protein ligase A
LLRTHQIIAAALDRLGAHAAPYSSEPAPHFTGHLCFKHLTAGDLIAGSNKITGSAQRKQRGALLQHGSILLAQSPYTPMLPGIRELTGKDPKPEEVAQAILEEFANVTAWRPEPSTGSRAELERRQELVAERYANDYWNNKR